ncbi:MAG: Benzylsuccinate synthase alpha subunit [candidate division BRC1 bacterium ADurb.BinA364]|nr:MAG: Benzylsuccinate synthase alpha subunit [candidate division BRC1 bacterium ADurb.BinA364]
MTVGGVDSQGRDATNDLSYLFLEALERTEVVVDLSARWSRQSPQEYRRTVMRVVRKGLGRPSVFNDDVTIEAIARTGIDIEDARDYAPLGCVEVMIPGRSAFRTMGFGLNLLKVLELTLNEGRCLVTGEQVWPDVPSSFESFENFVSEFHAREKAVIDLGVEIIKEDERIEASVAPQPWLTVLSRGGIEDALDLTAGQPKYDPVGVTLHGLADVANSLCAIKRLVFEERRLSLDELRRMLRDNWAGHETMRQRVIHQLPRFGQDKPEINAIIAEEARHYAQCFKPHRTHFGGPFWPMIFGVSTSLIFGHAPQTGATPSGRRRGETIAQSLQPCAAGPQGCATEILRSIGEIDYLDFPGGISNVQDCDPSLAQGPEGLERLQCLFEGFFALGGMELYINFLGEEKLREAQADPDRHRYLMVRLFGLSAQFVNLSPAVQESVIERVRAAAQRR